MSVSINSRENGPTEVQQLELEPSPSLEETSRRYFSLSSWNTIMAHRTFLPEWCTALTFKRALLAILAFPQIKVYILLYCKIYRGAHGICQYCSNSNLYTGLRSMANVLAMNVRRCVSTMAKVRYVAIMGARVLSKYSKHSPTFRPSSCLKPSRNLLHTLLLPRIPHLPLTPMPLLSSSLLLAFNVLCTKVTIQFLAIPRFS